MEPRIEWQPRQLCGSFETRALVGAIRRRCSRWPRRSGCRPQVSIERRLEGRGRLGDHNTSMLQDLQTGRRLELDVLSTAVLELGELTGVELPMVRAVHAATALLDDTQESTARPHLAFRPSDESRPGRRWRPGRAAFTGWWWTG